MVPVNIESDYFQFMAFEKALIFRFYLNACLKYIFQSYFIVLYFNELPSTLDLGYFVEFLNVCLEGAAPEEFSLTSTPRRSPAATPTTGTPTALVSMTADSAEALEAKAALRQVNFT